MEQHDKQIKVTFSKQGAWLGLAAYVVLVALVVLIFKMG